jgi:hypothetical protein
MKTKLEVLLPNQVNCGNPSQKNLRFVVFCQLHPAVVEDSEITTYKKTAVVEVD